jgi:hypothetical protein
VGRFKSDRLVSNMKGKRRRRGREVNRQEGKDTYSTRNVELMRVSGFEDLLLGWPASFDRLLNVLERSLDVKIHHQSNYPVISTEKESFRPTPKAREGQVDRQRR